MPSMLSIVDVFLVSARQDLNIWDESTGDLRLIIDIVESEPLLHVASFRIILHHFASFRQMLQKIVEDYRSL